MKTIAHISDLHFGAEDPEVAEALVKDLRAVAPEVIAVSGDITQRARDREFKAARAWLDRLPGVKLVVPGNHDVPLFDVLRRAFQPTDRFREHLHESTEPVWADDALLLVGVDTTRRAVISSGRISGDQLERVRDTLAAHGDRRFRAVVAHHPFVEGRHKVVGGAARAVRELASAGVDLVLAGHHHIAFAGDLAEWHVGMAGSVLVSHAGTAMSYRRRGTANEWTRIDVDGRKSVRFEVRYWDGTRFLAAASARFRRDRGRWHRDA